MEKDLLVLRNSTLLANTTSGHQVEQLRNKILSVEARFVSDLDTLAQQLQSKFQENDDVDARLKDALECTLNDSVLGQDMIQLVTHEPGTRGAGTAAINAEVSQAMHQLHGVMLHLLSWNDDRLQMDNGSLDHKTECMSGSLG